MLHEICGCSKRTQKPLRTDKLESNYKIEINGSVMMCGKVKILTK